ncbi:MAG: hypothetical protein OXH60_11485 [Rhodospirillales bacterium]|nr:hypothetical protein [Rhodospirillales bacterium]
MNYQLNSGLKVGLATSLALWTLAFWLPAGNHAAADEPSRAASALFTGCNPVSLRTFFHAATDDASRVIELTTADIETAAESRLRAVTLFDHDAPDVLNVRVIANEASFNMTVVFLKAIYDPRSSEPGSSSAWIRSTEGAHFGEAGLILDALAGLVDAFLDEFSRANQHACDQRT